MPATLLLVVALWDWTPAAIEHFGGKSFALRCAFLAVLLMVVANCLKATADGYAGMTVRVGSGGDAMWTDSRGREVNRVLGELARHDQSNATLAVAPEGIILNYLTRRVNPTPYITLMPVEVIMFGEERILQAFERRPPDYLILTDESTSDYGFTRFGSGYAEELFAWMKANYQVIGQPPSRKPQMIHAVLMARNAEVAAPRAGPDSADQSPPEQSDK